jgi:hypothetical protein
MKVLSIPLITIFLMGCSSKKQTADSLSSYDKSNERSSFLSDCSAVDTSINEFWILLCQREPHPQRSELYEYSLFFKTFKRLTYQDGRIQEMAVIGIDDIIYSSTYDEAKEKFLDVSQGATPGTDLYLRRRTVTDFKRLTKDEGSDRDLFWSKELKALLFVNSNTKGHTIRKLTSDEKVVNLIKASPRIIMSPITISDGSLLWVEWDEELKRSLMMRRPQKAKEARVMFVSSSKLVWIRPQQGTLNSWLAFVTNSGTELWSLDFERDCFYPRLQNQKNWSRFFMLEGDQVELSIENSGRTQLSRYKLNKAPEACQFSPPILGIQR